MDYEQPQALSKVELAQFLWCQQRQIAKLSAALARLEARLEKVEARLDQLENADVLAGTAAEAQREGEQATRDALRHLDDVTYLAESRLAKLIASYQGQPPDGHTVHRTLVRAIYRMKPAETPPHSTREHRRYDILRLAYLEKKSRGEIVEALAISERQYYREIKAAIQTVAGQILGPWSKSWQNSGSASIDMGDSFLV